METIEEILALRKARLAYIAAVTTWHEAEDATKKATLAEIAAKRAHEVSYAAYKTAELALSRVAVSGQPPIPERPYT